MSNAVILINSTCLNHGSQIQLICQRLCTILFDYFLYKKYLRVRNWFADDFVCPLCASFSPEISEKLVCRLFCLSTFSIIFLQKSDRESIFSINYHSYLSLENEKSDRISRETVFSHPPNKMTLCMKGKYKKNQREHMLVKIVKLFKS